jgi:hypothetical protein
VDPLPARRDSNSGDSVRHDAGGSARRSLPRTRIALRVVLAVWLAVLLLGSLGELFGIQALVEATDYRTLFLR